MVCTAKGAVITIALAIGLSATPASAVLLFSNLFPLQFGSFSFTGTVTGNQLQVADDFTLASSSAGWALAGARWYGTFIQPGLGFLPTVGASLQFDLLVFEDSGGRSTGTPLDPVPGSATAHRQVTLAGSYVWAGNEYYAAYNAT